MAKYRADSAQATTDGTGMIAWDIWALDDNDLVIGAKHKTVLTPYAETQAAILAGGAALVELLVEYAPAGWDGDALDILAAENINAGIVAAEVVAFVEDIGGFPKTFNV